MGRSTGFGHTSRVTPASRTRTLGWAALAAVLFGVLGVLVTRDRAPLDALDVNGRQLEDWADDHSVLVDVLRVIEVAFGNIGMTVLTVLLALVLDLVLVLAQRLLTPWSRAVKRGGPKLPLNTVEARTAAG